MRADLGLDRPVYEQYFIWMKDIVFHGDFGFSFNYNKPVMAVIQQYMGLTLIVSLVTMAFQYLSPFPSASIPPSSNIPQETISFRG